MGIGVSARSAGRPHDGTKDVAGRAARRSRRVDEGSLRGCPDPAPEPFQPSERLIETFINFEVCAPSAPCPPGRPCAGPNPPILTPQRSFVGPNYRFDFPLGLAIAATYRG